jgi:glucose/mannose transport system permease protein
MPFYVMIMAAFKTPQFAEVTTMWLPPSPFSFDGLQEAWSKLSPNFLNSFTMVVPAVIISSAIGSFNGYLLSKFTFRFSNIMFTMMLVGMFIPYQSVLIPLVKFLQLVNLYGTTPGLVLVHVVYGIPITTLIFRNFYVSIPKEIVEAAAIDGAGILRTFFSVIVPVSIPGFVVAVALNNLSGTQTVNWNVLMAGALIAAIPTAMAYLGLGRYFIQGLTAGSVK